MLHLALLLCCCIGFGASIFMHRKAAADKAGQLTEASVVQTPRARLFGGVDNAAIGLIYYPAVLIGSFFLGNPIMLIAVFVAASLAALVSLYLAYSLLYITRMSCPLCMTSHVVNLVLVAILSTIVITAPR
jgi:uncharacterized membrane protein